MPDTTQEDTFTVLFVCTGNLCRSPTAERLARAYLDEALGPAAPSIRLHSAGTRAVVGSAMHPDSSLVLSGLGGDPAGFVARQLTDRHTADADLTLTMTRAHRRAVLERSPRALSRTFTLLEAADLLTVATLEPVPDDDRPLVARARDVVAALASVRSRRSGGEADDVRDPIGLPLEAHQQVGDVIAAALVSVLDALVAGSGERTAAR